MAKTTSDKPSASAGEALKRRKKQAGQEAKLMLEIEAANKDLKKAQKRQSKAQAQLEAGRHLPKRQWLRENRLWRNDQLDHQLRPNDQPVVAKVPGSHTQMLSKGEAPSWKSPNKQSTCWQRWRQRCRLASPISATWLTVGSMCTASIISPCTWQSRNTRMA